MERLTLRLEDPSEIAALVKQLRTLRRMCLSRGGTRRVTYADGHGASVVFEAAFDLAAAQPPQRQSTPQAPPQGQLF